MQGLLTVMADPQRGLVRVTGSGFWSAEQITAHFVELEGVMHRIRRDTGHVRVLVDLREAAVQSQETAAIIGERTRRIYAAADRAAVVVARGLLAMQIRNWTDAGKIRNFEDMGAAERWLAEIADDVFVKPA